MDFLISKPLVDLPSNVVGSKGVVKVIIGVILIVAAIMMPNLAPWLMKSMLAAGLGQHVEGDYADVIETKPTNSKIPFFK